MRTRPQSQIAPNMFSERLERTGFSARQGSGARGEEQANRPAARLEEVPRKARTAEEVDGELRVAPRGIHRQDLFPNSSITSK